LLRWSAHEAITEVMERAMPFRLPLSCVVVLAAMALSSCENAGTLPGGGARSDYQVARQALETGNYVLAARRYESLMTHVQPGTARRLELEYAHTLLRADRHADAIRVAGGLVGASEGAIAGSALAVRGTARHEAARARIDQGDRGPETRALLDAARDDLGMFLRQHAALDAGGSMRARTELIAADLRSLG
jgi:hypothetical protein